MLLFISMLDGPDEVNQFTRLYNYYNKLAFWVANRILQDAFLAEDAVQEAFLRIARNFSKISIKDSLECSKTKNFVVIIVERAAIDIYRKRKKLIEREIPAEALEETAYAMENPENDEDNEIFRAIRSLPKRYSEVLLLRYVNGLNNNEIASLLNMKESTVRTNLTRGRKRLAGMIDERLSKSKKLKDVNEAAATKEEEKGDAD
ncbi:MAG: sigma-70 family RNA polymerase sigma factor [Lachnospiraceae bacterium]|nr:sigma-70 family RNA polymerase sigma factor [Lachnospiraceae bacterium]